MSASSPVTAVESDELPLPDRASDRLESRNILLLAGYQVLLRLAWVFKTESVVMPAFLHALSGQAWMQGWPNRLSIGSQPCIQA